MSKKTLMYIMLGINIFLILTNLYLKFSGKVVVGIESDKQVYTIKKSNDMTNEEFIDILYNTSQRMSTDIALSYLNDDYTYTYYCTWFEKDFFNLYTEDGMEFSDGSTVYSTSPQAGEKKIYGFTNEEIIICDLRKVLELKEYNLSAGTYLIGYDKADVYINELKALGMECSSLQSFSEDDFSQLYLLIGMFMLFYIMSIIFYVFSEGRDMTVKKSMGYGTFKICFQKLKRNGLFFAGELFIVLLVAFVIFSLIYDINSTVLFFEYIANTMLLFCAIIFVIYVFCFMYVCASCNVRHIKGMTRNRELYAVTSFFKTIILVVVIITISNLATLISDVYGMYKTTKNTVHMVEGYAQTELNVRIEYPMNNQEYYREKFIAFYKAMHEKNNLIVADLKGIDKTEYMNGIKPFGYDTGTINDNYLDISQEIFSPDGERITSSWLVEGKLNVLIPEGYDTTRYSDSQCMSEYIKISDINYIEYDRDSRFFTFDNATCVDTNGYCREVILDVYDIDFEIEHYHPMMVFMQLESFLTTSLLYKYDTESELSPFLQIKPLINELGLEKVMISSTSIVKEFYSDLKKNESMLVFEIAKFVIYIFAFVSMLVYSSELYYKNNAKEISVKQINGYSFMSIFGYRMILKACILPVLFILQDKRLANIKFPPEVTIMCVCTELLIFSALMKLHSRRNVVTVVKGE